MTVQGIICDRSKFKCFKIYKMETEFFLVMNFGKKMEDGTF